MSPSSESSLPQTLALTVDHEDTDEIFEAETMPNVQGDSEATPENEQAKSVGDETRPIGDGGEPAGHEQVVNEEPPVDQPQQSC